MKPIVTHSRAAIQWGKWDWFLQFHHHHWIPEQYIICSLYADNPLWRFERRVWMVWVSYHNDNFFILCGTVVCNFNVIHPQRRNTKGWGCSKSFFTASIWQANSHVGCSRNHVLTFSSSRTQDWKLAFFTSRPPRTLAFITQEFFPKPRMVIAVIVPYDTRKMSLGELVWDKVKWIWKTVSSKTSMMSPAGFKESLFESVCTGGPPQEGNWAKG